MPDIVSPTLDLLGGSTFEVALGAEFKEPGYIASDLRDGILTDSVVVSGGPIDTAVVTTFVLTYTSCDSAGNCASKERIVEIVNPCPPGEKVCPDGSCSTGGGACGIDLDSSMENETPDVEVYVPPADTTPPTLTISAPTDGSASFEQTASGVITVSQEIRLYEEFSDISGPYGGYVAIDDVDNDLTASVTVQINRPINTETVTEPGEEFQLTYSVSDSSGNEAPNAVRKIAVIDPCAEKGEVYCKDDKQCHADCVFSSSGFSVVDDDLDANSQGSTEPLALTVLGPGAPGKEPLLLPYGSTYDTCKSNAPADQVCDKGATASGGVTPLQTMLACGQEYGSNKLGGCDINSFATGDYEIEYSVTDFAGESVFAKRRIHVRHTDETCPPGERACEGGMACSQDSRCEGELDIATDEGEEEVQQDLPPAMALVTNDFVGSSVSVRQYHPYKPCDATTDFVPTIDVKCEPGATAVDDFDGNLTSRILACPPADCINSGLSGVTDSACIGHEFAVKGLQGCVNTSVAGSVYAVEFIVKDNAVPSNVAIVQRTVTIVDPCDEGFYWCSDESSELGGFCSDVECNLRESLLSSAANLIEENSPPTIHLVGPIEVDVNYLGTSSRSVRVCSSAAEGSQLLEDCSQGSCVVAWPCASFANDTQDGDLTGDTTVRESTCDGKPTGEPCAKCGVASFDLGKQIQCSPGKYRFDYTTKDSFDYPSGGLTVIVNVVEVAVSEFSFTVSSTAPSYGAAVEEANMIKNPDCHPSRMVGVEDMEVVCAYASSIRKFVSDVSGVDKNYVNITTVDLLGDAPPMDYRITVVVTVTTTEAPVTSRRYLQESQPTSAATAAAGDVAQKIGAVTQDGEGFGILLGEIAGEMGASVGSVVDGSASQPTTSQVTDSVNLSQVAFTRLQAELDDMNGSLETLRQTMSESKELSESMAEDTKTSLPAHFYSSLAGAQDDLGDAMSKADELIELNKILVAKLDNMTNASAQALLELEADVKENERALKNLIQSDGNSSIAALTQSQCRRNGQGQLRALFSVKAEDEQSMGTGEEIDLTMSPPAYPAGMVQAPPPPCEWHGLANSLDDSFVFTIMSAVGLAARDVFELNLYPVEPNESNDVLSKYLLNLRDESGFQMTVQLYPRAGLSWTDVRRLRVWSPEYASYGGPTGDVSLANVEKDVLARGRVAAVRNGAAIANDEIRVLYSQFTESPVQVAASNADFTSDFSDLMNVTTTPPTVADAIVVAFYVNLTRASQLITPCAPPPAPSTIEERPFRYARKLLRSSNAPNRRKLEKVTKTDNRTSEMWGGYDVVDVEQSGKVQNPMTYIRKRFVGDAEANRIIGGVLLQAVQRKRRCSATEDTPRGSDVQELGQCYSRTEMDSAPFGSNPIFRVGSSMFDPKIVGSGSGPSFGDGVSKYYNTTKSGTTAEVGPSGFPYAFFAHDTSGKQLFPSRINSGFDPSYPIYVDGALTGKSASRIFEYVREGHFVARGTDRVHVSMLVHNVRSNVFCRVRYTFQQSDGGLVEMTQSEEYCVPLVKYTTWEEIVIGIAEGIFTALIGYLLIRQTRKLMKVIRERLNVPAFAVKSYRTSLTWKVVKSAFYVFISSLQFSAMVMWWHFVADSVSIFSYDERYMWYDGVASSRGRPLLTARDGPAETFDGMNPAGSYRHLLAPDTTKGIGPYVRLHDSAETMIQLFSSYSMTQSLAFILLFINILYDMNFNRKFHVVIGTLVKIMPRLFTLAIITVVFTAGFTAWLYFTLGDRFEQIRTVEEALWTTSLTVLGETNHFSIFRLSTGAIMSEWDKASMQLWFYIEPLFMSFLLLQFIFVIILDTYIEKVDEARHAPGLLTDLWHIALYFFDIFVVRTASNRQLYNAFDTILGSRALLDDEKSKSRNKDVKLGSLLSTLFNDTSKLLDDNSNGADAQEIDLDFAHEAWPQSRAEDMQKKARFNISGGPHRRRCIDTGLVSVSEEEFDSIVQDLVRELSSSESGRLSSIAANISSRDLVAELMKRFAITDKVTSVVARILEGRQGLMRRRLPKVSHLDIHQRFVVIRRVNMILRARMSRFNTLCETSSNVLNDPGSSAAKQLLTQRSIMRLMENTALEKTLDLERSMKH